MQAESLRREHFEAALDILESAPHCAEEALAHLAKAASGEETQDILEVCVVRNGSGRVAFFGPSLC
jgi:hypothetical protein